MKRFICLLFIICFCVLVIDVYKQNSLFSSVCDTSLNIVRFEDGDGCQYLYCNNSIDEIVDSLNVEVVNCFNISDRVVVEGYINSLSKYSVVDGRKINVQMSAFDGGVLVGYPLINKSF